MKEQRTSHERVVSRRELLTGGSALAVGAAFSAERAAGRPTRPESGGSMEGFATAHAVETGGFDEKPFWFDHRNGSQLTFGSTSGVGSKPPDGYAGWRIADADVETGERAPWDGATTLFLVEDPVVEPGRATRYRITDIGRPLVGRFRRLNGNHTTEQFYPVSFGRVSE